MKMSRRSALLAAAAAAFARIPGVRYFVGESHAAAAAEPLPAVPVEMWKRGFVGVEYGFVGKLFAGPQGTLLCTSIRYNDGEGWMMLVPKSPETTVYIPSSGETKTFKLYGDPKPFSVLTEADWSQIKPVA